MLTQIQSLLAVAEEGSLHRAAIRLRLSQPALSRQMQTLEAELGGKLLERTSSGVKLTAGGRALVEKMDPILRQYNAAMMDVRRSVRGEDRLLRIGYLPSAAQEYLDPALKRVRREHPETRIKLLDLSPGEQITALREGKIDAGMIDDSGEVLARDFYTRKIASFTSIVALPEGHRLAEAKQVRLKQLKNDSFLSGSEEHTPGARRRVVSYCRQYGGFRPRFAGVVTSLAAALEMVGNENCVTLLPAFMQGQVVPGVVLRPIAEKEMIWHMLLVWQRGKVGGALRSLVAALTETERVAGSDE